MSDDVVLEKAVQRLKGLKFEKGVPPFDEPDRIYATLVGSKEEDLPVAEARDLIATNTTKLMRDADYLLQPSSIGNLVSRFVGARRRYLVHHDCDFERIYGGSDDDDDDDDHYDEEESTKFTYLTKVLDQYISVVDQVSIARPTRGVRSLIAPNDIVLAQRLAGKSLGAIVWPPGHFVDVDIAIIGEETIRRELFGITTRNRGGLQDTICFPHDQDLPLMVRKYLSWLSLTEKDSDSHCALFLAPVAFINHEERQKWYEPTGHQARFYATIHEFLDYAHAEFEKITLNYKSNAICLLTPWFFDVDTFAETAAEKGEAVATTWEKTCFRAGMMLALTKVELEDQLWRYRLVLFKPGPPTYPLAAQTSERRDLENAWVVKMLDCVDGRFHVLQGWTDGAAEYHEKPPPGRGVGVDSVEASCEIVEEIMARLNTHTLDPNGHQVVVLLSILTSSSSLALPLLRSDGYPEDALPTTGSQISEMKPGSVDPLGLHDEHRPSSRGAQS
ncbi:hypothetical protein F4775DRAFT_606313 [Biscogniauxia sp. FL1348]|nr:hypothetical protein F4775DRAFT_606313 [Biscogniauxia sp. FL1348]